MVRSSRLTRLVQATLALGVLLSIPLRLDAQVAVDRFDIRGQVRFLPNGNFVATQGPVQHPTPDPLTCLGVEPIDLILQDDWPDQTPATRATQMAEFIDTADLTARSQAGELRSQGPVDGVLPVPPPFDVANIPLMYTLAAGDVPLGEGYEVDATIRLDQGNDVYRFAPITTDIVDNAVLCDPIADPDCTGPPCDPSTNPNCIGILFAENPNECAGVVLLEFVQDATCSAPGTPILPDDPNYPTSGTLHAYVDNNPGDGIASCCF